MRLVQPLKIFVHRLGGSLFATLYACVALLFFLPLLSKAGNFDIQPVMMLLAVAGIYSIKRLSQTPGSSSSIRVDPLTGLLDRDTFIDKLKQVIDLKADGKIRGPVVVMVVDVNHFRQVNESLGYVLGDRLLIQIGQRLRSILNEKDVLARIGSNEFGVIINSVSIGYLTLCDKLTAAFSETFDLEENISISVGISNGIATYPEGGTDALTMLRNASVALNQSKRSRTSCVVFDPKMDQEPHENISLASALRSALENNEFVFHFQPQFNLKTNRISGCEALIRWKHPTKGMVRPDQFIPLAEQSNHIGGITSWSLREGITKLSKFRELGHDIHLSINISPYAIVNSDILVSLTREIVYNSIPYRSLIVEITESSIEQSPEDMARIIACLEMLGIQISIDDFGTGHASLLYLKHLPIKEIKIDKTFVSNMLTSPSDASIVKSTIELAHGLNCEVVAEGVETIEVQERLRELGCDVIQGYLVAKPLVEEEFIALLEKTNGRKAPN